MSLKTELNVVTDLLIYKISRNICNLTLHFTLWIILENLLLTQYCHKCICQTFQNRNANIYNLLKMVKKYIFDSITQKKQNFKINYKISVQFKSCDIFETVNRN